MDIKKYFSEIKGDLPSFEEFDSEFEISDIETNFAFKIGEKICDKVDKYRKIIEDFIHSDGSNLAVLMEINGLDEKDKEELNILYRDMIIIDRNFLICELENKESNYITFIVDSIKKWNQMRPKIKGILVKAVSSWKDELTVQDKLGYLG